jgi:hypothetical protein
VGEGRGGDGVYRCIERIAERDRTGSRRYTRWD